MVKGTAISEEAVRIHAGSIKLDGNLAVPENARGIVLFAHGSGSSRHSPRNRFVARSLEERRAGTLLVDLLTRDEEAADAYRGQFRFDIDLLARRLVAATDWAGSNPETSDLPIGYFGASTGAAAALAAAAERPELVRVIVSRGGRPDLAGPALARVRAPTLLIVGGADHPVIRMNEQALRELRVQSKLEIIPDATHLFEEPGALEQVARLAGKWFEKYLKQTDGF